MSTMSAPVTSSGSRLSRITSPGMHGGGASETDEKYLAYMKAVRVARQRERAGVGNAPLSAKSSPARPMAVEARRQGQARLSPAKPLSKTSNGGQSLSPSGSYALRGRSSRNPSSPAASLSVSAAALSETDSSDSIDFEVKSFDHIRSVIHSATSASGTPPQQPQAHQKNPARGPAKKLQALNGLQDSSSSHSSTFTAKTKAKMGKGEGVVVEADMGFKDGLTKGVMSPPASHVDDSSQEKTAKKIAELESLKKLIDEQRTPGGSGIQGGSRFSSAKDELKAQLSSIKAGLAASETSAMVDDDEVDEVASPNKPKSSDTGMTPPWSSKREQLKAKLQSYQAQLRIAQSQGIARRLDTDEDDNTSEPAEERAKKLQDDIMRSVANIQKIKADEDHVDADGTEGGSGSVPPEASRKAKEGKGHVQSPYAGVYPASDNFQDLHLSTQRSTAKSGGSVEPMSLKPVAVVDGPDPSFRVDEDDPVMIAGENLRQVYASAGYFAYGMLFFSLLCFIFGIFMPWGFSAWAIALPLGLASGTFVRYCLPLPPRDDNGMPMSLACASVVVIYGACFLFTAGILSASASLSIAPIIGTPVCNEGIPTLSNVTSNSSRTVATPAPRENLTNSATNPEGPNPLSGLDVDDVLKLGGCQAWNMCGAQGIKMLDCSTLKGFNDWNSVFFFLSSLLIPALWSWIYYTVSIRLQENAEAMNTGCSFEPIDCGLIACFWRLQEYLAFVTTAEEHEVESDEENPSAKSESFPKFDSNGPYRAESADRSSGRLSARA